MTIHEKGIEWLATHLGVSNCTVSSGISGTYNEILRDASGNVTGSADVAYTGGTAGWLITFYDTGLVNYITIGGNKKYYSAFKTANKGADLLDADIFCVRDNLWCIGATIPSCVVPEGVAPPPGEPTMKARVGTFDFTGTFCTGVPTGGIEVPEEPSMAHSYSLELNKKWFEINGVKISNTGAGDQACLAYFAIEMRMWAGDLAACPTTTLPVWKGMNKNVEEEFIRYIPIPDPTHATVDDPSIKTMFLDYFIPPATIGVHTICLYVWANFSKYDLKKELEAEGYIDPEY